MPFAQIVGHTRALDLLRRAVSRRSVPQSLLFAGPEGVGKRTAAIALAQAVNCPQPTVDGDACGACNTCRRILAGTFSDVVTLDKGDKASIGIDPLRDQVLGPIAYRPFEGRHRVFIIDPADEMTPQTQDALLKTLEEPPSAAIIILITAYPDSMLATVRSRCRRVRFGPLAEDDIVSVLTTGRKGLDPRKGIAPLDPIDARHRALTSGGSVSRALEADGREFTGDRDAALGLLQALQERQLVTRLKAAAAFVQVDKKRRVREAASARLAILASLMRDLMVIDLHGHTAIANTDLAGDLARLAPLFTAPRLVSGFATIRQAEVSLERNASPKIVADWLAVHL